MTALMRDRFPAVTWWCPQLPPSPRAAMQCILDGTAGWPAIGTAVIGSSLGGFYATAFAEQRPCKAVLLNPAIEPARDLAQYIGEQTTWHNPAEHFYFKPEFIDELHQLHAGPLKVPANYFAIIAKSDEVLDWREMQARYADSHIRLLEAGDHALSDFDDHVPAIVEFLELGA